MAHDPTPEAAEVLLLDIEGTTTSIAFVYDVLFPYARRHVEPFLRANAERADVQACLDAIGAQAEIDLRDGVEGIVAVPDGPAAVDAALANVTRWMDADRKLTALKELQGLLWDDGYASGAIEGHLYDDVVPLFARARRRGVRVAIYSSGSVHAQKLLFGYSVAGDLCPQISAFFDTTTGPKKDAESYRTIALSLGAEPRRVLFVSDNLDELVAADAAGMRVLASVRPGNPPLPSHRFTEVHGFGAVLAA